MAAALAIVAGLASLAAPASAQTEVDVAFNVGVVSDYVFRGASQTDEEPALQGGVDITAGSFYAGVWGSNVDFFDDTDAEIDFYGGFRGEAGGFALDGGVIFYAYVNEPNFADYNYTEFKLAASRAIGPASIGAAVYYSPDFFGIDESATYYELNGGFAPVEKLTISGAVGQQMLDVTDDYVTWNVGATYALLDHVVIDVRYHDTDVDGVAAYEDRIVGGLKVLF
jgi:uncharacterized protein (TIGR02001 family)